MAMEFNKFSERIFDEEGIEHDSVNNAIDNILIDLIADCSSEDCGWYEEQKFIKLAREEIKKIIKKGS